MPPQAADALGLGREVLEQGRDKISKEFQKEEVEEESTTCREKKKKIKIRKKEKEEEEEIGLNSRLKTRGDMRFLFLCAHVSQQKNGQWTWQS